MTWNGTRWAIQAVPEPAHNTGTSLFAVSCASATACTTTGFYDNKAGNAIALAERWDGARWRIESLPKAAKLTWFFGVSCPAVRDCTAVGYQDNGGATARPLAETWNGTAWRVRRVPFAASAPGGAFMSVSCTAPAACTAVGTSFSEDGKPLAERWNGKSWRVEATSAPPGFQASLSGVTFNAVSCDGSASCTAIGGYTPGAAVGFAEAWRGGRWSLQATAVPASTTQDLLSGISCGSGRCTEVGARIGVAGVVVTLVETGGTG